MTPTFEPGRNIAMKVPAHEYTATVSFYREVLGFEELSSPHSDETPRFRFGDKVLWIDRVAGISQAEIWLEVMTDDIEQAAPYLQQQGCHRRNEIEPLPEGFEAFWIASPSNIIHLVSERK